MTFFTSASSPLAPERREWIEARWRFLRREFGDERGRSGAVVVPTEDFFPGEYRATAAGVRRFLFPRVARFMDLDPGKIRLEFAREGAARRGGTAYFHAGPSRVSGFYRSGRRPTIALQAARFDDPAAVVGTLAHELGHVHLLGAGRVTPETEDHEPLTDLLTVYFGLGIFRAHCLATSSRSRGWIPERAGLPVQEALYLDAPHFGYAFALHARHRGEDASAKWTAYLAPPVRRAFERAARFLAVGGGASTA